MKRPLLETSADELATWMVERGHPGYRARQVLTWVFQHRAEDFALMSDLPKTLRQELDEHWTVFGTTVLTRHQAPDGTDKLLLGCADGRRIECLLMAEDERRTVCISTQVGCGIGCVFCASGLNGLERNLTAGEIVEQVIRLRNLLPADETLTNVVVMGMGESLANFDNLLAALARICSPGGLGLSQRRVTISTVGLPEKIEALAERALHYSLAVSLHAPTEGLRNDLVPVNEKIGLRAVIDAADMYFRRTGRQVTFEYVLLKNINDRVEDATALGELLAMKKAHVNLIPYNPVAGLPYERPEPAAVERFVRIVRARGVSVTVRKTKGREIDAACGQLRRRHEGQPGTRRSRIAGRTGPS
jgi:23S rRNA (adenine2503-C2)-methyltransferase